MTETVTGNVIRLHFDANETSSSVNYTLPDGYSYKKIRINISNNISTIVNSVTAPSNTTLSFPVVNGMSPCTFNINIADKTKPANLSISIIKFGQKPSTDYFKGAFEPILVTGKDGEEYNMIPSDQFK